jgi:putative ABC transport system permease protein
MQRYVNEYPGEALVAVLPGVALDELWRIVGVAEKTLLAVSAMVIAVGLTGLVAVILAGLNERRRELAILRSLGARPADIFFLLSAEGFFVTLLGALCGVALLAALTVAAAPLAQARFGIVLQPRLLSSPEFAWLALVVLVGALASVVPGYRAYRLSLADGLTPRL